MNENEKPEKPDTDEIQEHLAEAGRLVDWNSRLRARRNDIHVAQAKSKRNYFAGLPYMTKLEQAQADLDLAEVERDLSANNAEIERLHRLVKGLRAKREGV